MKYFRKMGKSLVGRRLKVYWELRGEWFSGKISWYNERMEIFRINYDDGDIEELNLSDETFRFEDEILPEDLNNDPVSYCTLLMNPDLRRDFAPQKKNKKKDKNQETKNLKKSKRTPTKKKKPTQKKKENSHKGSTESLSNDDEIPIVTKKLEEVKKIDSDLNKEEKQEDQKLIERMKFEEDLRKLRASIKEYMLLRSTNGIQQAEGAAIDNCFSEYVRKELDQVSLQL